MGPPLKNPEFRSEGPLYCEPAAGERLRGFNHQFPTCQLVLHEGQGLLGRPDVAIVACFDHLMLVEREEEFAASEIVLITCWLPDARRDFALVHGENSAAIHLAEKAAAKRNVAGDFGLAAHHLV